MHRPLRILQVAALPFPTPQGSQVHLAGRIEGLRARGHQLILCCYAGGKGPPPQGIRVIRSRPVPGDRTSRSGPHPSRLPQDLLLIPAIRRALAEPIDLIHAHNVEAPVLAWLASRRRKVPLIYEAHTLMAEELPTYLPRLPGVRRLGSWVDRAVPRLCDGAIALTERAADFLRPRVPHVACIPPGVAPGDLQGGDGARARQRWGLGERPVVLYAGNTDPYQDLPVLFTAMRQVDATLLVVTADPKARPRALARNAGLSPEKLRIVRTSTWRDTLDALACAQVAALPRIRCAGFPIKLLNQLGCGLPTVAARGSAAPIPGVVAVPDGDPAAMAAAITALLNDPGRRDALSEAGRQAVARDWTQEVAARRVERFYFRVLGRAEAQSQPSTSASAASM